MNALIKQVPPKISIELERLRKEYNDGSILPSEYNQRFQELQTEIIKMDDNETNQTAQK